MDGRECVAGFKGGITEWSNLASATTPGIIYREQVWIGKIKIKD